MKHSKSIIIMLIISIFTISCVRLIHEVTDTTELPAAAITAAKSIAVAPKIETAELEETPALVAVKKKAAVIIKGKVLFAFDSAELSAGATLFLDGLTDEMKAAPETSITLKGHTDKFGSNEYNQVLSEKRANSVKDYIIGKGIEASRINSSEGFGETQLLTELSNYENRRVIIASDG